MLEDAKSQGRGHAAAPATAAATPRTTWWLAAPPSTGRSLRAGNSSKHLSREPREKNSDQLKVPTRERETATHTGEIVNIH